MSDKKAFGVLFVCTGNICRSPSAEGILRAMARKRGLDRLLEIDSCGTFGYHVGEPPDDRAVEAAARRGYDLSDLRARKLEQSDFQLFDYILAMDGGHLEQLRHYQPADSRAQVHMMMAFTPGSGPGQVADPYYGSKRGFEEMLDQLEEGCRALVDHLEKRLQAERPAGREQA